MYFNFGCENTEYYKCELKKNRLNCDVKYPSCEGYEFLGWYEANNYEDKLDLYGTFLKDTIIYARWKNESGEIYSTYEEPSMIVDESSSMIEVSSIVVDEPSSVIEEPSNTSIEEYTITLILNNGTSTQFNKVKAKYGETLPTIRNIPTRVGYTFMGWYNNADYTKGTQYYNASGLPIRVYDKKANTTLYAGWRVNVLSIEYNGNGGIWNKPLRDTYSVNVDGTVILKNTKEIYEQKVKYGEKIEAGRLLKYNGVWLNWKKENYKVENEKEYFVQDSLPVKYISQNFEYNAVELASYGGCNLSKSDCIITLKVNWKKSGWEINKNYGTGNWKYYNFNSNPLRKYYSTPLDFVEYVPERTMSSGDSLPLIIWLHGSGGEDYYKLMNSGLVKVVDEWDQTGLKNIPAVMIAPKLYSNTNWASDQASLTIQAIIKYAQNEYNINTKKIVLMGHSNGGSGVYYVAKKNQELFSSLVIMSGYIEKPETECAEYFKSIPTKGYTEIINSNGVETRKFMISFFKNTNQINNLTIYEKVTHGQVPKLALIEDKNGDKISDLIYWSLSKTK